ncbi:MAG: inorganic diphosphatase [Thermoproteota archaeon]|nr:inorganic diphosphatase [Thermoproteota archaeon]
MTEFRIVDNSNLSNDTLENVQVLIEIPKGSDIKYEFDPTTGFISVDRKLYTAMHYPCNYGFIPNTLEDDGDPVDVLVLGDSPLVPMSMIKVVPVGLLLTKDEEGSDSKIMSVPISNIDPSFSNINNIDDVPSYLLDRIKHFFEHYKELEPGKYVRVTGWGDRKSALEKISAATERFTKRDSSKGL